jgi:hypothetical protein
MRPFGVVVLYPREQQGALERFPGVPFPQNHRALFHAVDHVITSTRQLDP